MNYLNAEDSANWLAENKILLHPTEGVWGIGCNAKSSMAIDRIFDLKTVSYTHLTLPTNREV